MAQLNSAEWWDNIVDQYEQRNDRRDRAGEYREVARFVTGPVIEVGSAFGAFTRYLPPKTQYLGIDISGRLVRAARKAEEKYPFLHADFLTMELSPFKQAFDCAVSLQVLEHFEVDDFKEIISRFKLVARKRLIFSVPRGMPTEDSRRGDGHVNGWRDEADLATALDSFGKVKWFKGEPHHLCGVLEF